MTPEDVERTRRRRDGSLAIDEYGRAMCFRQEGVDGVRRGVEGQGVGPLLGPHRFAAAHGVGIEDLDQSRVTDGDVQPPEGGVELT